MAFPGLALNYSPTEGLIEGKTAIERRLSDLRGAFADPAAYAAELAQEDRVLYRVTAVEPAQGEGQLHYTLGVLMPGTIGQEYILTRGHAHAWRPAAEVYLCLRGQGIMLLEDATTGRAWHEPFPANGAVYVPGSTFHRTVNTGEEPLVYWGIYPWNAGHDYEAIAGRNFRQVVVRVNGQPQVMERAEFLKTLGRTEE
jgi:glucose-6-phosphate isomerase, archaeal